MRSMLVSGALDERSVELTVEQRATPVVFSGMAWNIWIWTSRGCWRRSCRASP